jgi:3-isopropylmalate dehydrogenase
VLSVAMLLEHVGDVDAAARVEAAVAADLASRDPRNPGTTGEIGERLAKAVAS